MAIELFDLSRYSPCTVIHTCRIIQLPVVKNSRNNQIGNKNTHTHVQTQLTDIRSIVHLCGRSQSFFCLMSSMTNDRILATAHIPKVLVITKTSASSVRWYFSSPPLSNFFFYMKTNQFDEEFSLNLISMKKTSNGYNNTSQIIRDKYNNNNNKICFTQPNDAVFKYVFFSLSLSLSSFLHI